MKHEFFLNWKPVKGLGTVQVCKVCGVMRKPVKGVFHYYHRVEHLGTGLHNNCPVNFAALGVAGTLKENGNG